MFFKTLYNLDSHVVNRLNFTQAVITEIERLNSVAPTNAPRVSVDDTMFGGYFIPKVSTE